jgi:hypothetical protein
MAMARSSWDGDERGVGIADGSWIAAHLERLRDTLSDPEWVTEQPEDHLLPHLVRACESGDSPWRLAGANLNADGVFAVDLVWNRPNSRLRQLQADMFALIGEIAENVTFVRQVVGDGSVEYHVATGMLSGDSPFAPHGHLLQLRVAGPFIPARTDPAVD